jgi:predicted CoA-binding protein
VVQVFSSAYAFAALRADGSVVTWGEPNYGGDSSSVADKLDGKIDVVQVFSSNGVFAALREDGALVTWGDSKKGGDSSVYKWIGPPGSAGTQLIKDYSVMNQLDGRIDVVKVFPHRNAFAALRADGSVIIWGDSYYWAGWAGSDSRIMEDKLDGTIDVIQVKFNYFFGAIREDGSIITGGGFGGVSWKGLDETAELDGTIDVVQIFSSGGGNFAALRQDGSVVTWVVHGPFTGYGYELRKENDSRITDKLDGTIDVVQVFPNNSGAFAALRADGSLVTSHGGDSSSVAEKLDGTIDVIRVFTNENSFSALRADGSVVTWGDANYGGDSSSVADKLDGTIDVVQVFSSTNNAFAALREDGSVVTWGEPNYGGDSSRVADKLDGTIDVVKVFSNNYSFSALRADGSLVTWGDVDSGGDSSSVATELSSGVLTISNIEDNTNLIFPVGINTINSN